MKSWICWHYTAWARACKKKRAVELACTGRGFWYNMALQNAMKTTIARLATLVAAGFTLAACQQGNGALSQGAVRATLAAKTLMVTPSDPEWLLQAGEQHKLTDAQRAQLRRLLKNAQVREVPDSMYRSAEEGNRHDSSNRIFYIYGSNGQCLGARVIDQRVMLDDLQLDVATQQKLYTLLKPHLVKLFKKLP